MFVCVCRAVTDREILDAVDDGGVHHADQLEELCGAGSCCGTCKPMAQELIDARLLESRTYAA